MTTDNISLYAKLTKTFIDLNEKKASLNKGYY